MRKMHRELSEACPKRNPPLPQLVWNTAEQSRLKPCTGKPFELTNELELESRKGHPASDQIGGPVPNNQPEENKGAALGPRAQIQAQIAYMWVGPSISFLVLLGFFFMLYKLLSMNADALGKLGGIGNVLFTLLGALGAAFTQVVNYWLGSSKGSSDKTNLLAAAPPIPPPLLPGTVTTTTTPETATTTTTPGKI